MNLKAYLKRGTKGAEIVRFAMVGGFCTVLQYGLYVVFVHAVKVPAVVSTMISYAISFVANFFLSSFFTFKSDPNAKKGLAFTLSHLINMGMQTGFVAIFKGIVGPTLALLPALGICVPINYLMVRFAFTGKWFQNKEKQLGNL
jgi:membrane protein